MPNFNDLLKQAGFRGPSLATARRVALAESGGNPLAHNPNAATGDNSYGLFQINMLGGMGPERRARYGLASNEDLFDPLTNAKVAYALSKGGTDFTPWSTYKSGAYKKVGGAAPDVSLGGPTSDMPDAPETPDLTGTIFANLSGNLSPEEQLSNLTGALMGGAAGEAPGAPETPSSGGADRGLYASKGMVKLAPSANRQGVGIEPGVIEFADAISGLAGEPLTIGTGTNHNRFVVGTNRESAHWTGRAADIPATGENLTRLGQDALIAAGMPERQARKQKGGLFNVGGKQIIFNSNVGGNHFNHLHIGLHG